MQLKQAQIGVKSSETENMIVEFVASEEIVDYDSEIVRVEGMNFDNLMNSNKSFLWAHKHDMPPVGKILEMKKYKTKVKGKAQMTTMEENPFGYMIYKLIKGGFVNNVSIGFVPDYDSIEYTEIKGKKVRVITKSNVFEVSAVPVGANPNALITAVKSFKKNARVAWDNTVIDGKELNQLEDELDTLVKSFSEENKNELKELKERLTALEQKIHELTVEKELQDEENNYIDELLTGEFENIGESKDITTMNSNEDNYKAWLSKFYK